jgi:hypothetical protein
MGGNYTLPRNQKGNVTFAWGNPKADREAKQVAVAAALLPCPLAKWDPWYTTQEQAWLKTEEGNVLPNG